MATYRYLFADLRTNQVLAELPLKSPHFELGLPRAGAFSGSLPLGDAKIAALDPINATIPTRTAVYVDRDGVLLWGGIIWTRRYRSNSKTLELTGAEFRSYFDYRQIITTAPFAGIDQLAIARSLVTAAQAYTGGDIGVTVGAETSGVLRDRTYNGYELKNVGEALTQLCEVDAGFDLAVDVAYVAGVPTKTLALGYPRRGRRAPDSGWMFEYPGNITDYEWPEDGTGMATTRRATGAGDQQGMLIATAPDTSLIDAGYPLLEDSRAYGDVVVQATLQAHANADLAASRQVLTIPTITVRADMDPMIGTYIVGDDCRVRIQDERFPAGIDGFFRIVNITVDPQDNGPEKVVLTLGQAL